MEVLANNADGALVQTDPNVTVTLKQTSRNNNIMNPTMIVSELNIEIRSEFSVSSESVTCTNSGLNKSESTIFHVIGMFIAHRSLFIHYRDNDTY